MAKSPAPPPQQTTPPASKKTKALVVKNQLRIEFDEKLKQLSITTPGGNQILISDMDSAITLKDVNGNSLEMNRSGIVLNSAKEVVIKAKGNISLQSVSGDISLTGMNVKAAAQMAFTAQGTSSAELKASGQTTVKGGMVMIN